MPSPPADGVNGYDLSYIVFDGPLNIDMSKLAWT